MPSAPLFKSTLMQKTAVAVVMAAFLIGAILAAQVLASTRSGGRVTTARFIEVHGVLMVVPTGWEEAPDRAADVEKQMGRLQDVYVLVDPNAEERSLLLAAVVIPAPSVAILDEFFKQRLHEGETPIENNVIPEAGVFNVLTRDPEQGIVGHVMTIRSFAGQHHWLLHLRHKLADAMPAEGEADTAQLREQFQEDVYLMLHMLESMQPVPRR